MLNSRLIGWFLGTVAPTSGMGTLRWKKVYVERIPIPRIGLPQQKEFVLLVDCILGHNVKDNDLDLVELEAEIDHQIYDLYGLTVPEIMAIESQL